MSKENIIYSFNEYLDNIDVDHLNNVDDDELNETKILELMKEFENLETNASTASDKNSSNMYSCQEDYIMSELKNYDMKHTVKQLLLICEYYGLTKMTKNMKKQDIIVLLILFEKDIENIEIVIKRKEIWEFLNNLKMDKIMKKFIIW